MNALARYTKAVRKSKINVFKRLKDAEKYMDEPYNSRLTGEALESAVKEREKYVGKVLELIREAEERIKNVKEQSTFMGKCDCGNDLRLLNGKVLCFTCNQEEYMQEVLKIVDTEEE